MNWRLFLSEADSVADSRLRLSGLSSLGSLLLLIIGVILVLAAIVTGQAWAFLLGTAQLLIIPFTQTSRLSVAADAQTAMSGLRAGFVAAQPCVQAAVGGTQRLALSLWIAGVRLLKSVAAGLAVGLLVLGWFAFQQPELWRWGSLQAEGVPLAALVISIGTALLTMLGSLWVLNWNARSGV